MFVVTAFSISFYRKFNIKMPREFSFDYQDDYGGMVPTFEANTIETSVTLAGLRNVFKYQARIGQT